MDDREPDVSLSYPVINVTPHPLDSHEAGFQDVMPIIEAVYQIEEEEVHSYSDSESKDNTDESDSEVHGTADVENSIIRSAEELPVNITEIKSEIVDDFLPEELTGNFLNPVLKVDPDSNAAEIVKSEYDIKSEDDDFSESEVKSENDDDIKFEPSNVLGSVTLAKSTNEESESVINGKCNNLKKNEGQIVHVIKPKSWVDKGAVGISRNGVLQTLEPSGPTSFAGIAVPQNIVPCLSPEPKDKSDSPRFFTDTPVTASLFKQAGQLYQYAPTSTTSPPIQILNSTKSQRLKIVHKIAAGSDEKGQRAVRSASKAQPKYPPLVFSAETEKSPKVVNVFDLNQAAINPAAELQFIRDYQNNTRRLGKQRMYEQKQKKGADNCTAVDTMSEDAAKHRQTRAITVKLSSDKQSYQVDHAGEQNTGGKTINSITKPLSSAKVASSSKSKPSESTEDSLTNSEVPSFTSSRLSLVDYLTNKSNCEELSSLLYKNRRRRASKYAMLISRMNIISEKEKDEVKNLLSKTPENRSTEGPDAQRMIYLQNEIKKIKEKYNLKDKGNKDTEQEPNVNFNAAVPIVIQPTEDKDSIDAASSEVPQVIPQSQYVSAVTPSPRLLLPREPTSMSSVPKPGGRVLSSRYDYLTKQLKDKQFENLKTLRELNVDFTIPDQILEGDSPNDSNDSTSERLRPRKKRKSRYSGDSSDDDRYKDEKYLSSFISSFQNNPRRYKVYPQATKHKKTLKASSYLKRQRMKEALDDDSSDSD